MPRETGKRPQRPEDDLSLLEQIREANPAAGAQFLEYLVLQKRSSVRRVLLTDRIIYLFLLSLGICTHNWRWSVSTSYWQL